jgi:hypothetical protein
MAVPLPTVDHRPYRKKAAGSGCGRGCVIPTPPYIRLNLKGCASRRPPVPLNHYESNQARAKQRASRSSAGSAVDADQGGSKWHSYPGVNVPVHRDPGSRRQTSAGSSILGAPMASRVTIMKHLVGGRGMPWKTGWLCPPAACVDGDIDVHGMGPGVVPWEYKDGLDDGLLTELPHHQPL